MKRNDCHQGKVIRCLSDRIVVAVSTNSENCDGCAASILCRGSHSFEIEIIADPERFEIGQSVDIEPYYRADIKALILFFISPAVIFISTLLLLTFFNVSQLLSGLAALSAACMYYAVLFIMRKQVRSMSWKLSA